MKNLKQALLKYQALTLRERLMVVATVLVILSFLADLVLFGPQRRNSAALQQQIAQQKVTLGALTKVLVETSGAQTADGLGKERAERDELRARVAQAESLIGLVSNATPLGEVLRVMLVARPDLSLVSLKTLPPEVFYRAPVAVSGAQGKAGAPALSLYKHGIEVAVKGNYLALLPYLESLQHNPYRIFWTSVKLEVATYPETTLKMMLYTLSDRPDSPLG